MDVSDVADGSATMDSEHTVHYTDPFEFRFGVGGFYRGESFQGTLTGDGDEPLMTVDATVPAEGVPTAFVAPFYRADETRFEYRVYANRAYVNLFDDHHLAWIQPAEDADGDEATVEGRATEFEEVYDGVFRDGVTPGWRVKEPVDLPVVVESNLSPDDIRNERAEDVTGVVVYDEAAREPTTTTTTSAMEPRADDLVVTVTGEQFRWLFEIPEAGVSTVGELTLPVGRPVFFEVTSTDVLHAFYVPAVGVKVDAFPGEKRAARATFEETGEYDAYCSEYCGSGHSDMVASLTVVEEPEFEEWVEETGG